MYQIDSNRVEDYLITMNNLVDELETVVYSMKNFEERLVWNSEAGEMNKDRYKKIMSYEEEVCDILNIFMLIYEKGLTGYGMTQEELQQQFESLKDLYNVLDEGGF